MAILGGFEHDNKTHKTRNVLQIYSLTTRFVFYFCRLNPAREYVPLPHVFPPFAIRKTLRVGTHSALAH